MADIQDTDKFLVNRSNTTSTIEAQDLMAELLDGDLMLVNRGNTTYTATGADIKGSIGGEVIYDDRTPLYTYWTTMPAGLNIDNLVVYNGVLYGSYRGSGNTVKVYRSPDWGLTWETIYDYTTDGNVAKSSMTIQQGGNILSFSCGVIYISGGNLLHYSDDDGATWKQFSKNSIDTDAYNTSIGYVGDFNPDTSGTPHVTRISARGIPYNNGINIWKCDGDAGDPSNWSSVINVTGPGYAPQGNSLDFTSFWTTKNVANDNGAGDLVSRIALRWGAGGASVLQYVIMNKANTKLNSITQSTILDYQNNITVSSRETDEEPLVSVGSYSPSAAVGTRYTPSLYDFGEFTGNNKVALSGPTTTFDGNLMGGYGIFGTTKVENIDGFEFSPAVRVGYRGHLAYTTNVTAADPYWASTNSTYSYSKTTGEYKWYNSGVYNRDERKFVMVQNRKIIVFGTFVPDETLAGMTRSVTQDFETSSTYTILNTTSYIDPGDEGVFDEGITNKNYELQFDSMSGTDLIGVDSLVSQDHDGVVYDYHVLEFDAYNKTMTIRKDYHTPDILEDAPFFVTYTGPVVASVIDK